MLMTLTFPLLQIPSENLTLKPNSTLAKLYKWNIASSLDINVLKINQCAFRTRKTLLLIPPKLLIGETHIRCVPNVNTRGVIFSENLYWDQHIDQVKIYLSRVCGVGSVWSSAGCSGTFFHNIINYLSTTRSFIVNLRMLFWYGDSI